MSKRRRPKQQSPPGEPSPLEFFACPNPDCAAFNTFGENKWQYASDGLWLGQRGLVGASLCMSPSPCQRSPAPRVGRNTQQPRRIGFGCLST
jgi:hypothetical protein